MHKSVMHVCYVYYLCLLCMHLTYTCYAMTCYVMICYVMLSYAILLFDVLCYVMRLRYQAMPCCSMIWYATLYCVVLC